MMNDSARDSVLDLHQATYEKLFAWLQKRALAMSVPRFQMTDERGLVGKLVALAMPRAFQYPASKPLP